MIVAEGVLSGRKDEGCVLLRSLFGWPQPSQVKVTWEGPWIYRKAGRKKLETFTIFYMSLLSSCLFSFVNSSSGAALSHLYFIISAYRYLSLVTGWTVEPQGILRVIVGRKRETSGDLWAIRGRDTGSGRVLQGLPKIKHGFYYFTFMTTVVLLRYLPTLYVYFFFFNQQIH